MAKESNDPAYLKLKKELKDTGTIKVPKSKGGSLNWKLQQVKVNSVNDET
tara:strand:+ start:615 stop:764 length:150 start_codon:yes stop_codon:yes gene_type:complete